MEETINAERMLENVGRVLNGHVHLNENTARSQAEVVATLASLLQDAVAKGNWYIADLNASLITKELPRLVRALTALNTLEYFAPVRDLA